MFSSTLKSDKKKLFNLIYSCQYVQHETDYAKIEENKLQLEKRNQSNMRLASNPSDFEVEDDLVINGSPKTQNKVTFKKGMKVLSATRPVLEPKLKITLKDPLPVIPS